MLGGDDYFAVQAVVFVGYHWDAVFFGFWEFYAVFNAGEYARNS